MDKLARTVPRNEQAKADLAFWLSRPMAERIAAVEMLRQQALDGPMRGHAEQRLQRVCRVAQRPGR